MLLGNASTARVSSMVPDADTPTPIHATLGTVKFTVTTRRSELTIQDSCNASVGDSVAVRSLGSTSIDPLPESAESPGVGEDDGDAPVEVEGVGLAVGVGALKLILTTCTARRHMR